jgi:hypothetical protein
MKRLTLAILLLAIGGGQATPTASAGDKAVLRLRAVAINMSGVGAATADVLDIAVERWSTDEERDRLRASLMQKGSSAVLSELQKIRPRAGYIKTPDSYGTEPVRLTQVNVEDEKK